MQKSQVHPQSSINFADLSLSDQVSYILELQHQEGVDADKLKKKISHILSQTSKKDLHTLAFRLLGWDPSLYTLLPEVLKQDKQVVLAAIDAWISISNIPESFHTDEEVLKHTLEQLIHKRSIIFEFVDLFEKKKLPKKLKQTFKDRFMEALTLKEYIFDNHLEQVLFELYLEDYKNFQMLQSLPLLRYENGTLTLDPHCIKACFVNERDSVQQKQENNESLLYEKLLAYCKLSQVILSPASQKVMKVLLQHITWENDKKRKEKENIEEDDNEKKPKEKNDTQKWTSQNWEKDEEFILPYRSFSYAGNYTLWDETGHVTYLAKTEIQIMSQKSLENYFHFSKLLTHLQLDFLLKKHASRIMLATGVNFYTEAGMTQVKTLKFLNNIAKNIGIPESHYTTKNPDGSEERKVWCFRSLDAAKKEFHEITETGMVGSQKVCDPIARGEQSIVEIFMKQQWLITPPYFEISLARWEY
jgi:hypothetical protein